MWFRKPSPELSASVFFRGGLAPRLENIRGVEPPGFDVEEMAGSPETQWSARLTHADWGRAEFYCPRSPRIPPNELIDHCSQLAVSEKREMQKAGSAIVVRLLGNSGHILRDRKRLLRFCGVALAEDGVAVLDHVSQLFWPRESLRDELRHDADVDISGLYVLHAVQEDGSDQCSWLHSHGLGEIGFWDFDILRPGSDLSGRGSDTLRALAFLSAEGELHPGSGTIRIFHPTGTVLPIAAAEFQKRCGAEDRALRQPEEAHRERRLVLCEPVRAPVRWVKGAAPSRLLSGPFPDRMMVAFSHAATELMAARAQATYAVLGEMAAEFADLGFPTLLKMGLRTDDQKGREHVWFEAQRFRESSVTATLINTPYGIARLREGMSGEWPVESLSDWTIMTPKGSITPASFKAAREVRADRDEVARIMREGRSGDPARG